MIMSDEERLWTYFEADINETTRVFRVKQVRFERSRKLAVFGRFLGVFSESTSDQKNRARRLRDSANQKQPLGLAQNSGTSSIPRRRGVDSQPIRRGIGTEHKIQGNFLAAAFSV